MQGIYNQIAGNVRKVSQMNQPREIIDVELDNLLADAPPNQPSQVKKSQVPSQQQNSSPILGQNGILKNEKKVAYCDERGQS